MLHFKDHISESKIKRAKKHLIEAKRGDIPKREPIEVEKTPSGQYRVIDGNTTAEIAKQTGWIRIPAIVNQGFKPNETFQEWNKRKGKKEKPKAQEKPSEPSDIDLAAVQQSQNKIDEFIDSLI